MTIVKLNCNRIQLNILILYRIEFLIGVNKLVAKIKWLDVFFILLLLVIYFFLNFHNYIFLHPQGVHYIRQTDSLSIVSNYYENGFHFFKPSLYNLMSLNGNGICEFPVLYYLTALLYLIFGEKEFLLKLIHLIIFSIGLFHVYKLSFLVLKDCFTAYLIPIFILSSTSLVYYSFNFLPDSAALGFAFSGLYFIFKYKESNHIKFLIISLFFFTLSSLLKVTYLIHPIAIYSTFFINRFLFPSIDDNLKNKFARVSLSFLVSFFIVVIWNCYVLYYNQKNNSTYFTTNILPIWQLSEQDQVLYWKEILGEWYKKYLAESSFHVLLACFLFVLFSFKKIEKTLKLVVLFLLIGSVSYFILFFIQFKFHDYYFLLFFPLIVFVLIAFFQSFQSIQFRWMQYSFKTVFLIVVIAGLNYARMKNFERYQKGKDAISNVGFLLDKNKNVINKLGIAKTAKIIVGPDLSINGSLYALKRKGWVINRLEDLSVNHIKSLKGFGANYFVLLENHRNAHEIIQREGRKIFQKHGLSIYKL